MKKILIGYITKNLGAGINQYIINFTKKISNEEVQIDFLTREDSVEREKIEKVILKDVKYNNLYFIPKNKNIFSCMKKLKKIMKREKYDIAYFNISSPHDCIGLYEAKKCGIKRIVSHSHNSSSGGGSIIKKIIVRISSFFGRYIVSNCANVYLACSKKAAKWLYPSYIYKTDSYSFINNTIDPKKFSFDKQIRQKIRKKIGIKNELLLGHIARFNINQKNNIFVIDILSEMLNNNNNVKLLCIGGGEDFDKVKDYANKKGVLENIIFTGRINNVEEYLHAIDIFILPSKFEGLPITGIEAQFNGIPCLFSNKITEEVIIGKNSKLLPIDSPKIWADEIEKIGNNRKNDLLKSGQDFDFEKNKQPLDIISSDDNDITNKAKNIKFKFNIEFLFAFLFMLEGFLQAFNCTVENKIISYVLWPMTFLGSIILLYRLFKLKKYKIDVKSILLILFDLTLLIPAFIFRKYRFYYNIKYFILMLFQFGILYLYSNNMSDIKKFNIIKLSNIFVFFSLLLVLGSFYVLLINYNVVINTSFDPIVFGISAGRLFGVFWDPNIGALISSVAFIISLHRIYVSNKTLIKVLNIIFCFLFALYISLSASRMSILSLLVCGLFYIVLLLFSKNKVSKKMCIVLVITFLISVLLAFQGRNAYNSTVDFVNKKLSSTNNVEIKNTNGKVNKNKKEKSNNLTNVKEYSKMERSFNPNNDISNRRVDIWKNGIQILKKEPLFGIGRANLLPYLRDELPNSYILNNSQKVFASMHSMFMDTAVSQGIVGLSLYLIFIIISIISILKNLKYLIDLSADNILFLSIILIEFMASLVITEIIFIDSPMSVLFWICLGQLMNYIDFKKKKVQYEK